MTASFLPVPRGAFALAVIPTLCLMIVALDGRGPLVQFAVGITVLTCPGLALLPFMAGASLSGRVSLVVASSAATNVVIAEAFLLSGAWSPVAMLSTIWALSLLAAFSWSFHTLNAMYAGESGDGPMPEPRQPKRKRLAP